MIPADALSPISVAQTYLSTATVFSSLLLITSLFLYHLLFLASSKKPNPLYLVLNSVSFFDHLLTDDTYLNKKQLPHLDMCYSLGFWCCFKCTDVHFFKPRDFKTIECFFFL